MKTSYSSDQAWADVVPVPQDDGPDPVCPIAYSAEFIETMNYFRAVLQQDERSERALRLTKHVIDLNPANYTAWWAASCSFPPPFNLRPRYFRRLCLEALGNKSDWMAELRFCDEVSVAQQKNYQGKHRPLGPQWC
jgi:protein farnesyltransferase/geranylgeranyltransferase type-1 subunit alpha